MHKIFQHFADERKGEWFKIDNVTAIKIFNHQTKTLFDQFKKELANAA